MSEMKAFQFVGANPFAPLPRPVQTYHKEAYGRISPDKVGFKGEGKTLLITAGATGIGFATCKAFAEAGISRIGIVARRPDSIDKAKTELEKLYPNVKVESHPGSIQDYERMQQVFKKIGHVDILVLSAAIGAADSLTAEVDITEFADVFNTNVMANLRMVQLLLAQPSDTQRIVLNVTSAAAQVVTPLNAAYGTSKAAFVQVLTHLATEHEEPKARFVSFHPGAIFTPLANSKLGEKENHAFWEEEDLPAHFAVWLASPEAAFLHGRYLWAEWDVDELVAAKDEILANSFALTIGLVQLSQDKIFQS